MSNTDNNFDPYDIEAYDWDEGGQLLVEDVAPNALEILVQTFLSNEVTPKEWKWLRAEDRTERPKRLIHPKYHVPSEDDRKWMDEEFPMFTIAWDSAAHHHDHPVSHLCTDLNEELMVEDIVRSGKMYIDLFGNPSRNLRSGRKAITLFTRATPRDYLRYQKTLPNMVEFDMNELCDPESYLGQINDVCVTHALYYLMIDDIARIVNTSQKRRLRALIHRHPSSGGQLNRGELAYVVDRDSLLVTQVNKKTGESYSHPTLEALFHQSSAKSKFGGVAWTSRSVGGDSYVIEFVACPTQLCQVFKRAELLDKPSMQTMDHGITAHTFLHWTWVTYARQGKSVRLDDEDLLTKLRRYVAGKSRDPRLYTEAMNLARRLTNKLDIISIHGGTVHTVQVPTLVDYVTTAFYIDVKHELETCIAASKENAAMTSALNAYYDTGKVPLDFSTFGKVAHGMAAGTAAIHNASVKVAEVADEIVRSPADAIADVIRATSVPKKKKKKSSPSKSSASSDTVVSSGGSPTQTAAASLSRFVVNTVDSRIRIGGTGAAPPVISLSFG